MRFNIPAMLQIDAPDNPFEFTMLLFICRFAITKTTREYLPSCRS